jgi:hypothetical protein
MQNSQTENISTHTGLPQKNIYLNLKQKAQKKKIGM